MMETTDKKTYMRPRDGAVLVRTGPSTSQEWRGDMKITTTWPKPERLEEYLEEFEEVDEAALDLF